MSDPFLGEIRLFAGNFPPKGWATCDGQIMSIQQNTALFSLLGTMYGGNGTSNFALPDFRGRFPIGKGQGAGLNDYVQGEFVGEESVALLQTEIPQHSHTWPVGDATHAGAEKGGDVGGNGNFTLLAGGRSAYTDQAPDAVLVSPTIGVSGGSQAHSNMQPYLGLTFIIATSGIFPSRN